MLPDDTRQVHMFKELKDPLISISQLCNSRYFAIFYADMVYIIRHNKAVLSGKRHTNGLYMIILEATNEEQPEIPKQHKSNIDVALANNVQQDKTEKIILDYYHICALYPTVSTWTETIDNIF